MSPIPDDFEQLRRLLALKRYEQPPPGYFHAFSRQVIVRIKAGDLGNEAEASFWSFGAGSFLRRVWATLDARPVFAGAFGVAVCGFFVVGAMLSDNGATATAADNSNAMPLAPRPPMAQAAVWQQSSEREFSSTVGVALPSYQAPTSSLFDEIRSLQQSAKPQEVNFTVPNNLR
jgi:hypothetical protein